MGSISYSNKPKPSAKTAGLMSPSAVISLIEWFLNRFGYEPGGGGGGGSETDPVFTSWLASYDGAGITTSDISNWDTAFSLARTTEEFQDAVGNMVQAGSTVDLTYDDPTGKIEAEVIPSLASSLTDLGQGLQLDGDSATPGNDKFYGTDGSGNKGWYAVGAGGGSIALDDLTDVDIAATPSPGDILQYVDQSGFWGYTPSPSNGQFFKFDSSVAGGVWVAADIVATDIDEFSGLAFDQDLDSGHIIVNDGQSDWINALLELDLLDDVVITSPQTDHVLKYNGTNWVNGASPAGGGGASVLSDLGDVTITTPQTGLALVYNGSVWTEANYSYTDLDDIPASFTPSAHSHTASAITDFDTEVSNNSSVVANTAKTSFPGFSTLLSDYGFTEAPHSKSLTIESPTNAEDITLFYTDDAITITQINTVSRGISPSLTYTIRHASDRATTGTEVVTGGSTTTSASAGDEVTSFNDATIPAGSWIWLETTVQSGTVNETNITIEYTFD
jgi:hypothetical protein